MEKWRLIINEGPADWCMALDEAMLILKEKGEIPNTLRLYVFNPSAVTIGYFQKIKETVDLDYVTKANIPVIRRITGGGAVYHDSNGEITYSVVADLSTIPKDVQESYERICLGIVYALEEFDLEAKFLPVNDVVVRNKKISGSAQIRRSKAFLQHGTLMYNTNLEVLARTLKVPKEKLESHGIKSILERVTTISIELGRKVSKEETLNSLVAGFKRALGIDLYKSNLTPKERELAEKLRVKYSSREWNFKR